MCRIFFLKIYEDTTEDTALYDRKMKIRSKIRTLYDWKMKIRRRDEDTVEDTVNSQDLLIVRGLPT